MEPGVAADVTGGLGTLLNTVSSVREGYATSRAYRQAAKNAEASGDLMAAQYNQQAGQTRASSQRDAIAEARRARLAQSRAVAVAAASGAGASDPTVTRIVGNLAAEGKYNVLAALYSGEEAARGLEFSGQVAKFNAANDAAGYKTTADAYKRYGWQQGTGTLLSGTSSFLEKYGGDDDASEVSTLPAYKQPGFRAPGIH